MITPPPPLLLPYSLLLLLSEPSANFLQLRGRRRQGRRRTFPGFGFQCGARAFASQGGGGGWEPGCSSRSLGAGSRVPTDWREERGLGRLGVRRGGGAVTSVLEEGGCRSRMSGSSAPAILWSGRGERNPRVHTLDAAWKRGEGSNSAEDTDGINYSVSISMPPGFHSFPFPADSH